MVGVFLRLFSNNSCKKRRKKYQIFFFDQQQKTVYKLLHSSLLFLLPLLLEKKKYILRLFFIIIIIIIIIMTPPPTKTTQGKQQQQQQHPAKQKKELVDLECDDEFEEFEEEGALVFYRRELDLNKVASTRMMKRVVFENFFVSRCSSLARSFGERVTEGPLSLSLHPCFYAYRRVDERKRGKRRRGAMGGRLGRHGSGRFQDALERRAEKECRVATTPTKIK